MANEHILIVEDEPKICRILEEFFHAEGWTTEVLNDGADVLDSVKNNKPCAIILDLMLPNKDGISICKELREFSTLPILMLTARVDEIDRLLGLHLGADDYICKPFSARELVARIKTIFRRSQWSHDKESTARQHYRELSLDMDRFECRINNTLVSCTPVELRLLNALIFRPGVVCSREKLMALAYDDERIVSARTIDSHMKNLRNKLHQDLVNELIHTVYGVGYKLE